MSAEFRWPQHLEEETPQLSDELVDALVDLSLIAESYFRQHGMLDDLSAMKHWRLGWTTEQMRRAYERKHARDYPVAI